jgi:hypothetical protein
MAQRPPGTHMRATGYTYSQFTTAKSGSFRSIWTPTHGQLHIAMLNKLDSILREDRRPVSSSNSTSSSFAFFVVCERSAYSIRHVCLKILLQAWRQFTSRRLDFPMKR